MLHLLHQVVAGSVGKDWEPVDIRTGLEEEGQGLSDAGDVLEDTRRPDAFVLPVVAHSFNEFVLHYASVVLTDVALLPVLWRRKNTTTWDEHTHLKLISRLSALRRQSHHRVFKYLPQVVVEMVGLVVLRGQDAAKRVQVGDEHEDTLRRSHSQSEVSLQS